MSPRAQTIAVLRWTGVPEATAELALIADDPDAPGGTFVHWVLYAVPAGVTELGERTVPAGAVEGVNDFGRSGWGGPCPPRGHGTHRYVFHVYALSKTLGLPPGATAGRIRDAMRGSVAGEGTLTGRYGR